MMMMNKIILILKDMVSDYDFFHSLSKNTLPLPHFDWFLVELMRLMGTAKDDMRRAIIQESLNNLDSPERSQHKKIGQIVPNIFETEKVDEQCSLRSLPQELLLILGWKELFKVSSNSTNECKIEKTFNE